MSHAIVPQTLEYYCIHLIFDPQCLFVVVNPVSLLTHSNQSTQSAVLQHIEIIKE